MNDVILVEFLDNYGINNVYASLAIKPKQVVFISKKSDLNYSKARRLLENFYRKNASNITTRFVQVEQVEQLPDVLREISKENSKVVIELTGGLSPLLFNALLFCRDNEKISSIYVDYKARKLYTFSGNTADVKFEPVNFNVALMLEATGATIKANPHKNFFDVKDDKLFESNFNMLQQFIGLLRQAQADNRLSELEQFNKYLQNEIARFPGLRVDIPNAIRYENNRSTRFSTECANLYDGKLFDLYKNGRDARVEFKGELARSLFVTTGVWLEYLTFCALKRTGKFSEVKMSVEIDWIGYETNRTDPINEIDVIAMKGLIPYFISCKTSSGSKEDLNEIKYLSRKFGGNIAKSVIVYKNKVNPMLKVRADEMDIILLDDILCDGGKLEQI